MRRDPRPVSQRASGFGEHLGVDDEEATGWLRRPCSPRRGDRPPARRATRRRARRHGRPAESRSSAGPTFPPTTLGRPAWRSTTLTPTASAVRARRPSPRRRGAGRRPPRLRWPGSPLGTCRATAPARPTPATTSSPGSRRRARRSSRPDGRPGASRPAQRQDRRGAAGPGGHGPRHRTHRARRGRYTSPARKARFAAAWSRLAAATTSGEASTPVTRPGSTRRAMSAVIVPGPHPTSSTARARHQPGQEVGRPSSPRSATGASGAPNRGGRGCSGRRRSRR